MAAIELMLAASMLVGTALLVFGLHRLRAAEQNARIDAHFLTFKAATRPPWLPFFEPSSHGGVIDAGLAPARSAPEGFDLGALPRGLAVGEADRGAATGLQILRLGGARFQRDAVAIRPAWTWRGYIPFLAPNAFTQGFLERGDVRGWYDGAVEATTGDVADALQLSDTK